MKITTKLFFRECKGYTNSEGTNKLRVRFLDEQDKEYTFFFEDNDKSEKYKTMKKDTICELELILYSPRDVSKSKYNLIVR